MTPQPPNRGDLTGTRELRHVAFAEFEIRSTGDSSPHFSGYATVFDSPYTIPDFWGSYIERTMRGAFRATLAAKADVRLLVNHNDLPLARTVSGTLKLTEDETGLKVDADLDATDPDVARILPKMARGDLSGMSFAFIVRQEKWIYGGKGQPDERQLLELDIHDGDVSIVTYPANPAASAQIRSAELAELDADESPIVRVAALLRRGADLSEHADLIDQAQQALKQLRGTAIVRTVVNLDYLRRQLDLASIA